MKLGEAVQIIALSAPRTGNAIAAAVQAVAQRGACELVCDEHVPASAGSPGSERYLVGQSSRYRPKDIRIEVPAGEGWTGEVDMRALYDRLRIVPWEFAGKKYVISHEDEEAVNAVKAFRDALAAELGASSQ